MVMLMNFRPKTTSHSHLIDDETGIEFLEKDVEVRIGHFTREGWDSRTSGVVFVFRDPRWKGSIEFPAMGLGRIGETKWSDGTVTRFDQIYGFSIQAKVFDERFGAYTNGDPAELAKVKRLVTEAIIVYLGKTPDKEVLFQ
jgi:hypothetical protein